MKVFCSEEILLQHYVLGFKIDLYFPEQKVAIEVDKKEIKTKINAKKLKQKKLCKNILIVNLLELILMKKILMFMLKLVNYTITLIKHLKNKNKQDFKNIIRIII